MQSKNEISSKVRNTLHTFTLLIITLHYNANQEKKNNVPHAYLILLRRVYFEIYI